jgi:hypothetical protein
MGGKTSDLGFKMTADKDTVTTSSNSSSSSTSQSSSYYGTGPSPSVTKKTISTFARSCSCFCYFLYCLVSLCTIYDLMELLIFIWKLRSLLTNSIIKRGNDTIDNSLCNMSECSLFCSTLLGSSLRNGN